jgi:TolB-like protein/DNA-binding winged helix-turn-helix (wHTH) protein
LEELNRDSRTVRFGVFEADLRTGELRKGGLPVKLQEQPFRVLALLLDRPGDLVTREELRRALWPDEIALEFDQGLNNAIKKLRRALDDSAEEPRFIETLSRRGYRFLAPVQVVQTPGREGSVTTREPKRTLRPFIVAGLAAAALLTVVLAIQLIRPRSPTARPHGRVMLAVLPFENLSGDPQQQYFTDGMTEEMIAQIGRLRAGSLRVIGRASAMAYRGAGKDIGRIARELRVDYVLTGSVRRSGERVRVTAGLSRARDQTQLWTRTYDRQLRDIIGLQVEVARAIARELPIGVSDSATLETSRFSASVNPEAYEAYLKGRFFWNKIANEAVWKALEYFQQSIALDPDYAPAHAGLSSAYGLLSVIGEIRPREGQPDAGAAARRALELDGTLPMAHVQLGFFQLNYEWDFGGARKSFRRALELDPSSSAALHANATALAVVGKLDAATAEMRRAVELDPLWLLPSADLCMLMYFARQYEPAIAECRKALEMDPGFPPALYYLGGINESMGRYEEAFRNFQRLYAAAKVNPGFLAAGEEAFAAGGWEGVSKKWLELQLEARRKFPLPAFSVAISYARVGDKDAALEWLEKACEERHFEVVFLKVSPKFDPLRSDPRFERLLRRMRLSA